MNIWEFFGLSNDVRLTSKDGRSYEGYILNILDVDDQDDATEPEICLETPDGIIGFWESEIASIELVQ